MVAELTRRLTYLEKRVAALSKNEVLDQNEEEENHGVKKKNRRKFM